MRLNKEQEAAVTAPDGPVMVIAGPGSGKTFVITQRLNHMISGCGILPENILVVTFTRAAADEMKDRFTKMAGRKLPVTFGTFHSVFFNILKYAYGYSAKDIIAPDIRRKKIREELVKAGYPVKGDEDAVTHVSDEIAYIKENGQDPALFYSNVCPENIFRAVYKGYDEYLRASGLLDFEDMVKLVYELFKARPDILAGWQRKYTHILVDEFQDINPMQYDIIKLLAADGNLFVVGDDDQSIYRFRGARPEIMLGFGKDFKDAKILKLSVNYRSVPDVVETSVRLIGKNRKRFDKQLEAFETTHIPVKVWEFSDLSRENNHLANMIAAMAKNGIQYEDIAILYRTNTGPRGIVEKLNRLNIPFNLSDAIPDIYSHWIAQDIITYLMIGAGSRRRGDFLRIINRPVRYLKRELFSDPEIDLDAVIGELSDREWLAERVDQLAHDIYVIAGLSPYEAIRYIRKFVGYDSFLREYAADNGISEDSLMAVLDDVMESASSCRTLKEWMEQIREEREIRENGRQEHGTAAGVSIMTMHRAKGLEFDVVFVPDANAGIIPHKRAVKAADQEEERRLFYVAMTRAKKRLYISYVRQRFDRKMNPSPFVAEAGLKAEKM